MERDMDLIRKILLKVQESPAWNQTLNIDIPEYSAELVSYHIKLLKEAEFVEAAVYYPTGGFPVWRPMSLTWQGHEFLAAAQNEKIWNQAKSLILGQGGGLMAEMLKSVLVALMMKNLGM